MNCSPAPLAGGDDIRAGADHVPTIALVGRPNVGKSTFFARATGRYAEASNAPGTTVATDRRRVHINGREACLVDFPGTASLANPVAEETPFWSLLLGARPDALLVVADAGDLARHLPLVLACRDLGLPIVLAANLTDEADGRGVRVDTGRLSQLLAAPVHRTSGRSGLGVAQAVADAVRLGFRVAAVRAGTSSPHATVPARVYPFAVEVGIDRRAEEIVAVRSLGAAAAGSASRELGYLVGQGAVSARGAATLDLASVVEPARWEVGRRWADQVVSRSGETGSGRSFADRLGPWTVAPWPGIPLFIAITLGILLAMMATGTVLAGLLTAAWQATASPAIRAVVGAAVPDATVGRALLWGLDDGILSMLAVGIPYILTFYVLLAFLEDSGYLTSVAVLTDRVLGTLGLSGRVSIPILAATGCNVPAIYGTRLLASRRERVLASFLITMTPCSARIAVVCGALVPFAGVGPALAAFGVIACLTVAGGLLANRLVPGRQSPVILELAPLRRPVLGHVARKAWWRFESFVRSAAPLMIVGSIVLGFLYETGLVWRLTAVLDPITVGWLGLPSVAGLALVFAFLRKELALQLLATFAIVELGRGAASIGSFMSAGQLFVYAVVTAVSFPCIATLATLTGELGRRAALLMSGATIAIALLAGGLIARVLQVA
jgi:ferrous iron transport protein B